MNSGSFVSIKEFLFPLPADCTRKAWSQVRLRLVRLTRLTAFRGQKSQQKLVSDDPKSRSRSEDDFVANESGEGQEAKLKSSVASAGGAEHEDLQKGKRLSRS